MYTSIISGIVSSIIAIVIVNIYLFLRNKYKFHRQKSVLSINGNVCLISAPVSFKEHKSGVIFSNNSFSFAYVITLLNQLRIDNKLIPYDKISEYENVMDEICIGGPSTNERTKIYLEKYLPAFKLAEENAGHIKGFEIGDKKYNCKSDIEPALIIKVKTLSDRTVILLFGMTDKGTAAASYFFTTNPGFFYSRFKKSSFCVVVNTNNILGHKFTNVVDDCSELVMITY